MEPLGILSSPFTETRNFKLCYKAIYRNPKRLKVLPIGFVGIGPPKL